MRTTNEKRLNEMIKQIESYQQGLSSLRNIHENIWGLFELIDQKNNEKQFNEDFHKHWDHIEEIVALNEIDKCLNEINSIIIPNFKKTILSYTKNI